MGTAQIVFAVLLVIGVSMLSLWYFVRQFRNLRRLGEMSELPAEELRRERRQVWRRIASSGLLLLIACLVGVVHLGWESSTQRIVDASDLYQGSNSFTEEQRRDLRIWGGLWLAILLLLLVVIILAAFDLWAIRRYGRLQHRKISDDRRAMIARQLHRLRQERNGEP